MNKPSAKQLKQRREMAAQHFNDGRIHNARKQFNKTAERKQPTSNGNANIGTDEDVKAYCARMGYAYESKP